MLRRNAGALMARAWTAVRELVGLDELYLYSGLLLIALGLWDVWRPGAYIVPGVALVWISLPKRTGFIDRGAGETKKG